MAIEMFLPYENGLDIGVGLNSVNGQILSNAVSFGPPTGPEGGGGQIVTKDMIVVNSFEALKESLGIDVSVSAQYLMFSASEKFSYAKSSSFNHTSSFAIARCVVQNPTLSVNDAALKPDAAEFLTEGNIERFKEIFGDCFVRGMISGGELYVVFQFDSDNQSEQEKVSNKFSASFNAIIVGVQIDTDVEWMNAMTSGSTKLALSQFQQGGQGIDFAIKSDTSSDPAAFIKAIIDLMNNFVGAVSANPVPSSVFVQQYSTLPLPGESDFGDIQLKIDSIQQIAKNHDDLLTLINDLEFITANPDKFDGIPSNDILTNWKNFYADELNTMLAAASACANDVTQCRIIPRNDPDNFALFQNIKRKDAQTVEMVAVPDVVTSLDQISQNNIKASVENAQDQMNLVGLVPIVQNFFVLDKSDLGDCIVQTDPVAGTIVPKNTNVILFKPFMKDVIIVHGPPVHFFLV